MALYVFDEPVAQATLTGGLTVATNNTTGDAANVTINNNLTIANLTTVGGLTGAIRGAGSLTNAATITNNGTIAAPGSGIRNVRVQATAACTSAAIATGTIDGQELRLINPGATAITISTNVNAATTLAATGACLFSWDAGTSLWYHSV